MKRQALGKGIHSLIPEATAGEKLTEVDIARIQPSPYQPRRSFDKEKLEELAASIRASGIIQPVVLAKEKNGSYSLIAGERRWRAAQLAGLHRVPAVIRDLPDEKKAEYALIENIQRQDLNPVEEALAYQTLLETFKLTQEVLAERVGKKRSTIANLLRILKLPAPVQASIEDGRITLGHAKILSALDNGESVLELAREIEQREMTVRALERRLRQPGKQRKIADPDVFLKDGEERLSKKLGTSVRIKGTPWAGDHSDSISFKRSVNCLCLTH